MIELAAGDLVVVPHGLAHTLLSDPLASRTPFADVLEINGIEPRWEPGKRAKRCASIRFGGDGPLTRVVNGIFKFRNQPRNPVLAWLPKIIHVHGRLGRGLPWLENALQTLLDEATFAKPGYQTIAERLADIIFVQAVRCCLANSSESERSGWLRGLMDPEIAKALSLIHEKPYNTWTVGKLAKAVGLSRTSFAERFRALVNSSVMSYVTAHRMQVAADLLTSSRDTIFEVAAKVGYDSEMSLSRAFRRWAGVPPGKYRRLVGGKGISLPPNRS